MCIRSKQHIQVDEVEGVEMESKGDRELMSAPKKVFACSSVPEVTFHFDKSCGYLPSFPSLCDAYSKRLCLLPCHKGRLCCHPIVSPKSSECCISFCSLYFKPTKQISSARHACTASQCFCRANILCSLLL